MYKKYVESGPHMIIMCVCIINSKDSKSAGNIGKAQEKQPSTCEVGQEITCGGVD